MESEVGPFIASLDSSLMEYVTSKPRFERRIKVTWVKEDSIQTEKRQVTPSSMCKGSRDHSALGN